MDVRKETESTVDIAKFFFCVCIIALHATLFDFLPGSFNYYVEKIALRLAVPYFFVCSGFFLGNKVNKKGEPRDCVKAYIKRLLFPLLVFSVVNIAQQVVTLILSGYSVSAVFITVLQHVLFYPYGALWYVQASIGAMLLLYPFIRFRRLNLALFLGALLFMFALLCNTYYGVTFAISSLKMLVDRYLEIFLSARNSVFVAFLYLAIGLKLNDCMSVWRQKKQRTSLFLFLGFTFMILVVEVICTFHFIKSTDDGSLYISHLFFVPALFVATLLVKLPISDRISVLFRNCSTGMYYLHRPILWCISFLALNSGFVRFIITFVCCLAICLFSYRTKSPVLNKLLR